MMSGVSAIQPNLEKLRLMCRLVREHQPDATIVRGTGHLRGIDVDMHHISDTVMTLGAVACFADGPTRIRNVAHIRHKETDRIAALATELRRLGADVGRDLGPVLRHPGG